jgi:hypothetical protein
MALTEKITCDNCQIIKENSNHWMLWRVLNGGLFLSPWSKAYRNSKYGHICGSACASSMLSKSIGEWGTGAKLEGRDGD